jgi:hypothetical protein
VQAVWLDATQECRRGAWHMDGAVTHPIEPVCTPAVAFEPEGPIHPATAVPVECANEPGELVGPGDYTTRVPRS